MNNINNQSTSNNQTILDVILEKTSNLEHSANANSIRQSIKAAIKEHSIVERQVRSKTITFNFKTDKELEQITEAILGWTTLTMRGPVSIRNAKDKAFIQMASIADKDALIDWIKMTDNSNILKTSLTKPTYENLYFERLPIKVELNNIGTHISLEKVKETIESCLQSDTRSKIIYIKDGKINTFTKKRTISMKINGSAFSQLFINLNAMIPLIDGKLKVTLFPRINCRPWQCGSCFMIGQHTCPGKSCANCGNTDHTAKDCKKKTKFCKNCNRAGHRARDASCPKYLSEVSKEIRKYDFPLEVLSDSDMCTLLVKQIQLK